MHAHTHRYKHEQRKRNPPDPCNLQPSPGSCRRGCRWRRGWPCWSTRCWGSSLCSCPRHHSPKMFLWSCLLTHSNATKGLDSHVTDATCLQAPKGLDSRVTDATCLQAPKGLDSRVTDAICLQATKGLDSRVTDATCLQATKGLDSRVTDATCLQATKGLDSRVTDATCLQATKGLDSRVTDATCLQASVHEIIFCILSNTECFLWGVGGRAIVQMNETHTPSTSILQSMSTAYN